MQRMTMLLAFVLIWPSPVFAGATDAITPGQLCCQYGQTVPSVTVPPSWSTQPPTPITCSAISARRQPTSPGGGAEACINAGGQVTTGPCNSDGACGGSLVCCAGASVGESCPQNVATTNSCALATEAACDALSPAGAKATVSEPGQNCAPTSVINFSGPWACQMPIFSGSGP
jgi:hypothetical protein